MILITTQTFPPAVGGMENLMCGLADAFVQSGESVRVFADAKRDRAEKSRDAECAFVVDRFGGPRMLRRVRKARAINRAIGRASQGVTAVVADSWKSLERLTLTHRPPIICLAHGSELLDDSPRRCARVGGAFDKADGIVANSAYVAALAGRFSPAEKINVIPPGIAPLPSPDDAAKKEFASIIKDHHPILATVARLEPRKGIDTVIRALSNLVLVHPKILYLIGGDGDDKKRLQLLSNELGVAANVHFAGVALGARKVALLTAADLFVMTTWRVGNSIEGFGIAYLEAAACGVPALGGKEGGATDAIVAGQTGCLCDGKNPAAVAAAIADMLADPARLTQMGAAARHRAAAFSWDTIVRRYLALIDSVRSVR